MLEIEITTGPKTSWIPAATRGLAIVLRILMVVGAVTLLSIESARAALVEGSRRGDLLFGADDDDPQNPLVQPPGAPNQSLNDTDVMDGREGDDVMIALLGADVMHGGTGHDVPIGGTEQGAQPNSDVIVGDDGRDVSIWRGGDGSDVFIGGRGTDALVMGATLPPTSRRT